MPKKAGFPTMLPTLPPLKKPRGYRTDDNKHHGETGFGFSALTAEIAKARAVLATQVAPQDDGFRLPGLMHKRQQYGHSSPTSHSPHSSSFSGSPSYRSPSQKIQSLNQQNGSWPEMRSPESDLSLSPKPRLAKAKRHLKPGRKLKSLAKKRGRRRKKKKAATLIQRFWLKRRKHLHCATVVQAIIRGFIARRVTKRMLQAKEAGVMVAMKGTRQGRSGWYQDFDGQKYYFAVDAHGTWWQVMKPSKWETLKETLNGVSVLVAREDTKMGTAGYYFEHGPTSSRKDKARCWRQSKQGIWEPRATKTKRLF